MCTEDFPSTVAYHANIIFQYPTFVVGERTSWFSVTYSMDRDKVMGCFLCFCFLFFNTG